MRITWTEEQTKQLIAGYPSVGDPRELAKSIGKTYPALKTRAMKMNLKRMFNAQTGRTTSAPEQDKFLKENYLSVPVKRMAKMIGRSHCLVVKRMKQLSLVQPRGLIEKIKSSTRFKTGTLPFNKGLKREDFMTPEGLEIVKSRQFKKGNLPGNTLHDGAIVTRNSHKKMGGPSYKWIRISKANWKMLNVFNWENAYGPVPEGYIIVFRNGDTMNCDLDNLECITRVQHCENTRNSDGYIAMSMAHDKGGRGKINRDILKVLIEEKELIDLKRQSIKLKKIINEQRAKH